jgi:hypothetical protein
MTGTDSPTGQRERERERMRETEKKKKINNTVANVQKK